jgi:hypothetical protein
MDGADLPGDTLEYLLVSLPGIIQCSSLPILAVRTIGVYHADPLGVHFAELQGFSVFPNPVRACFKN